MTDEFDDGPLNDTDPALAVPGDPPQFTHGGRRPGAGRPRHSPDRLRATINQLEDALLFLKAVEQRRWRSKGRKPSKG
jgi:hypothetical protein